MEDRTWAVLMVIATNLITIGVSLFSNRSGKVDKNIEKLFERTDKTAVAIGRLEKDLELFRKECQERHGRGH